MIALLAAASLAVVLAAFCAAERSGTAFDRLRDVTHASDVVVHIGSGNPEATLKQLRATPGVIDARAFSQLFLRPEGTDLVLRSDLLAIAPRLHDPASSVDTAVVTAGRAPRPDRSDEVAISASLAADLGLGPGDELRLETMTDTWVSGHFRGRHMGEPDGPTITTTVTGIARSPAELGRFPSMIHLTAAFVERYGDQMSRGDDVHVRLEPAALERHQSGLAPLLPGSFEEASFFVDAGSTRDALGTIATALRLVGSMAGLAGTLAVTLALARSSRASGPDRSALVALGWTQGDQRRALALTHLPALAAGGVVGIVVGVLASTQAMVGLARSIDPHPEAILVTSGVVLPVVCGALAAAAVALAVASAAATRRASRATTRAEGVPLGRPLAVVLGLRQALVAHADRGGRASRGAMAAIAGAAAVAVGALGVSSSISHLQSDPSLIGQGRGRVIDSGELPVAFDAAMPGLEADDRVEVLAANYSDYVTMRGIGELRLLVHEPRRGQVVWSVTEGRMPRSADEIALGPATLDAIGAQVGSEVEVSGYAGADRFRVVGAVLLPEGFFDHDKGAVVTFDGGGRLLGDVYERAARREIVFDWAEEVDAAAADRELAADGFAITPAERALKPGTVNNLGEVEALPRQLALLVGLLAFATLLHAAWSGVVLRARELVTLRAIGITQRSIATIVWTHSLAIVAVGVLVGAPFGVVAGRGTWRLIAERAHVVVRPVLAWSWLAVAVGAALLAGLVVAAVAGSLVGRLRPAVALRAE